MEDEVQRKFSFALKALKLFGDFEEPFLSKLYGILYLTSSMSVLFGCIIGFINREQTFDQIEVAFSSNCVIFIMLVYYYGKSQRKPLKRFLLNVSQIQSADDDIKSEILQLTIEKSEKILLRYSIIMFCIAAPTFMTWCFTPLLDGFDYGNKNFYLFPYIFKCTDNNTNQFPVPVLCIKEETALYYFLTYSLIIFFCGWGGLIMLVWTYLFSLFIRIFVGVNILVIEKKFSQLKNDLSNSSTTKIQPLQPDENKEGSEKYYTQINVTAKTQMIKIIRYHQHLFKTMKIIIPYMKKISNMYLILCIANPPGIFYAIQNQDKSPGYWWYQMKNLGMASSGLLIFFMITHSIQSLSDMQADINNAVYSMPWYDHGPEFRRIIIQFQILLQMPLELKAFGVYPINCYLFASAMRIAYSILNLMYKLI